ncbi:S8 family serine peptidase, partial [candidate division GN15 bacterium]|nr:S8 family serine peptidase [candidate division GN15 bacterium]
MESYAIYLPWRGSHVGRRPHGIHCLLAICLVVLVLPITTQAVHSPSDWYETSPSDADGNKLDDFLDDHAMMAQLDVFVCFRFDCIPDDRMQELQDMGDIGYVSPVLAVVQVRNITLDALQNTVATWEEVGYICPNEPVDYLMTTAGEALKAHSGQYSPNTIEDQGHDGSGVTIAIIDSGVDDVTHPDLPAAVGGLRTLDAASGLIVPGNPTDANGHGTSVAGAALGRGSGGANRGTAPGASLFDARIEDSTGERSAAAVLAILDWIYLNYATVSPPIQVVNMSIGSDRESAGTGPTTQAIVNLGQIGITVVT